MIERTTVMDKEGRIKQNRYRAAGCEEIKKDRHRYLGNRERSAQIDNG